MSAREQIVALGRLEGVREATLCSPDGLVLESSSAQPELNAAAMSLHAALVALQRSLPAFGPPVTLAIDAEQGILQLLGSADRLLIVAANKDVNLGTLRLAMRQALQDFDRS